MFPVKNDPRNNYKDIMIFMEIKGTPLRGFPF